MHLILPLLATLLIQLSGWSPNQPPPTLPRYDLSVQLDYAEHRLAASQRIEMVNRWNHALFQVALHVPPLTQPDAFQLYRVAVGREATPAAVQRQDDFLLISLDRPWAPGDTLILLLDFSVQFPPLEQGSGFVSTSLGWSDFALNAGHWHPILAPYDAEAREWRMWQPSSIGDPYVSDAADYTVEIATSSGVQIVAGGEASHEDGVWSFHLRGAREFAFVAGDRWVSREEVAGGIRVTSYYLPEHQTAGEAALRVAADALTFYQSRFGTYPYTDFRLVESFSYGGMEFSAFSYITHLFYANYLGGPRTTLAYTVAHEVAHQWWYGIVGNDQVASPWLDEALTDYATWRFYQAQYPDDADWWWGYYVAPWSPTQPVDSSIYQFDDLRTYLVTVYRRGLWMMVDLENAMGRTQFDAALRAYQRRYAYHLADAEDIFGLLQFFAGRDLSTVWNPYLSEPMWLPICPEEWPNCKRLDGPQMR